MNRRSAVIAGLAGVLPLLSQSGFNLGPVTQPNPLMVQFADPSGRRVGIGWDLKTMEMVFQAEGEEVRITARDILEALKAK